MNRLLVALAAICLTPSLAVAATIWSFTVAPQAGPIYQNEAVITYVTITVDPASPDPLFYDFSVGPYFGYPDGPPRDILAEYHGADGIAPFRQERAHGIILQPGDSRTTPMTGWAPRNLDAAPGDYQTRISLIYAGAPEQVQLFSWTVTPGYAADPRTMKELPEPAAGLLVLLAAGFAVARRRMAVLR